MVSMPACSKISPDGHRGIESLWPNSGHQPPTLKLFFIFLILCANVSKFVLLHAVSVGAKRYWLLWCGSFSLPEMLRPKLGSSTEQHVL